MDGFLSECLEHVAEHSAEHSAEHGPEWSIWSIIRLVVERIVVPVAHEVNLLAEDRTKTSSSRYSLSNACIGNTGIVNVWRSRHPLRTHSGIAPRSHRGNPRRLDLFELQSLGRFFRSDAE
jgi:hypothetical protein